MSTGPNDVIKLGALKAHQRSAKEPVRRKRGGQPGNTNAFKHGFYTKNFSLAERRGLLEEHSLSTSHQWGRPRG